MTRANLDSIRRDLAHVWRRSGRGVWLEDYEGKRYLDAAREGVELATCG